MLSKAHHEVLSKECEMCIEIIKISGQLIAFVEREASIPYLKNHLLYTEMENLEHLFCELINYTMWAG